MTTPIYLLAPGADMSFGTMPSGSVYVSNQYGLITITNGSVPDELALIAAGCNVLDYVGAGNISAETARAEAAEAVLLADINAETTRAEGVEAALQTSLVSANIGIYASTSAAQSSPLANGAYYFIPSAHGGALDLYLKNSSASSTFVATLASVNQSSVTTFATVAALLTAYGAGTTLTDGQMFICAGRDAVFDSPGVSLVYAYDSGDTTSADNGGTIRVDGQGRRYYAIGPIYFDHFGMHASNTGAANNAGWQAALNWQRNGNGVTQGNPAPGKLWGRANSTYNVTVSGDCTGGLAVNNTTENIYIDGDGPGFIIAGTLSVFAPVLDLSGQPSATVGTNCTIVYAGSASCGPMNLALPVSQTNTNGNENGGFAFLGSTYASGSTAPVGGLVVQGCDNSQLGGPTSTISANASSTVNGPWAGAAPCAGINYGWVPPTQAGNIGLASSSTNNTVVVSCVSGKFPSTNGALVGFPLRKYIGPNIGNNGTYECNYITGYTVSGNLATITVASNWNANPVGGTDTIIVHAIKSLYQPLAGTGNGGGATETRISGDGLGQGGGIVLYCTGCNLTFWENAPYMACGGDSGVPTAIVCINNFGQSQGFSNFSGVANAENDSSGNASLIWACDSVNAQIGLSRPAGTFTQLFRATTADLAYNPSAGFETIEIDGGENIGAQLIFDTNQAQPILYVRVKDVSATALGTISNGIQHGNFNINAGASASAIAAVTRSGSLNGAPILQPSGYAGTAIGGGPIVQVTDIILPGVPHTTTGGSLQPRLTYTLAANAMTAPNAGGGSLLAGHLRSLNTTGSNCTCALKFTQSSNTINTNNVTVPANAVLVAEFWMQESGNIYYTLRAGTAILADSVMTLASFLATASLAIELGESGTGGDAMDVGGVHRFTLGGTS